MEMEGRFDIVFEQLEKEIKYQAITHPELSGAIELYRENEEIARLREMVEEVAETVTAVCFSC